MPLAAILAIEMLSGCHASLIAMLHASETLRFQLRCRALYASAAAGVITRADGR